LFLVVIAKGLRRPPIIGSCGEQYP